MNVNHGFPPFCPPDSRILILGSFPSVKSREQSFFYGHPQNRFWRVLAAVFGDQVPETVDAKKLLLQRNCVALYDVIESCDITGSSDSSIKNAQPANLKAILDSTSISRIILNGKTAGKYYQKFFGGIGIDHVVMPSTSPANASWSLDALIDTWFRAMHYI